MGCLSGAHQPGHPGRRADGRPLAHLGRARCEGPQPGDPAPHDPPGAQPDRGRPLHRGAARPARPPPARPSRPAPAFSSVLGRPRRTSAVLTSAYAAHLRGVVQQLRHVRGGHDRPVPGVGLHRGEPSTTSPLPALTMRDQTFAALGQGRRSFRRDAGRSSIRHGQPDLARVVTGTFDVPSYLTGTPGTSGSVLTEGSDGLPERRCRPRSTEPTSSARSPRRPPRLARRPSGSTATGCSTRPTR